MFGAARNHPRRAVLFHRLVPIALFYCGFGELFKEFLHNHVRVSAPET
jgi:hypothetical protein